MLQKELNQLRIKFYNDVEMIGFANPVTDIAEGTGYAKGNISSILSKKMQPSEPFLNKFYESFKNVLENINIKEPQPTTTNSTPNDDYQTRYIQLLERVIQDQSDIIKGVLNRIDANLVDAANKQQIFRTMTNANQQVILETLAAQQGLNKYELAQKARSIGDAHLHDIEETYNFDSSDSSDK